MILLAALLLAQAPPANALEAGPPEEDFTEIQDITVIAQKLRQISVAMTRNAQGSYQCSLSDSTGLLSLDGELCKTATSCVIKGKNSQTDVRACIDKAKPTLTARIRALLIAERAGAGA